MHPSPIKKLSPKQSSSLNISPSYPLIITPPLTDNTSPPPPNYNLLTNPRINISPTLPITIFVFSFLFT